MRIKFSPITRDEDSKKLWIGIKLDFINHHFELEFADSGLYFVQDENNSIYQLLQAVSGARS